MEGTKEADSQLDFPPTLPAESALPPGWEAVMSDKDQRIYYWNKKTGDATWKFPEQEAKQHQNKVRRHTYENLKKPYQGKPVPPSLQPLLGKEEEAPNSSPSSPRVTTPHSASTRRPYENVVLTELQKPCSPFPLYEEIEGVGSMRQSAKPLYGRGSVGRNLSEPFSPTSSPYSDTDVLSPPPDLPDRRYTPPPETIRELCKSPNRELVSRKVSSSSLQDATPTHEVSSTGSEYAIISQRHVLKKHQMREGLAEEEEGEPPHHDRMGSVEEAEESRIAHPQSVDVGVPSLPQSMQGAGHSPPTLPLRARDRMSRENLLALGPTETRGVAYTEVGVALPKETSLVSDQVPATAPKQAYQQPLSAGSQPSIAYSIVRLDPVRGRLEVTEEVPSHVPLPTSPQPYEVASPTTSTSNIHSHLFTSNTLHTSPVQDPGEGPHYEEIEREGGAGTSVPGPHSRGTRPRGFSSPTTLEHAIRTEGSPDDSAHSHTPSSEGDVMSVYDLPSNSRRLQVLNVTLRRSTTPQTEYAKLSLSREALLLRSGVTLRRHDRESLSSLSSYASRWEGEEPGGNSGPGTSDEEEGSIEPINKCIKSLESSLRKSGDDYKLVLPQQPSSPSWMSFKRRPHAYEEIMGASQEELDWDESDLGCVADVGGTHHPVEREEESETCQMVKVEDSPVKLREPRMRVVNHQYEDVVLGEEVRGDQSWVGGEGAGLPKGWQLMRDEQDKEYYWHIPTGRTQYAPPTATPLQKLTNVEGQPSPSPPVPRHSSPVAQTFPARYLGWMPIAENQLVTGQCVKAVHACLSKMAKSQEGKENKGEEMLLQVKGLELQWLKPGSMASMATQQINRIRVWGIGLENERDFGYVSRDPTTRKHRCHIFRCCLPARAVAHVLLEAHQAQRKRLSTTRRMASAERGVASPGRDVPSKATPTANGTAYQGGHERYERFSCVFVGSCVVGAGQGMEVVNEAVERLSLDQRLWQEVCVDVAPSSVTITDKAGGVMKEHRIRYLCFLGIARDDRFCGYILDSGEKSGFKFYGFRIEPNTDRLCLALHAACQARFKRVRESAARQQQQPRMETAAGEVSHGKSSSSLLGKFGSLKKKKHSVVETKTFAVQYLGQQAVVKVDGLDTVRPVVQELAVHPKPNCPQGVEFDVSPTGLAIRDTHGKMSRKEFPVKSITYVVKIRNYFAFVAREKSKYFCHAFMESEVDTGTIVTTIQNMLTPAK